MKLLSLEPESSASASSAMPAYPLTKHRPVKRWCEERESNPYGVNHTPLKRARLPVPPPSHRTDRRSTVKLTVNRQRINYTRFHGVCQGVFRKYLRQWAFTFSAVPNCPADPGLWGCPAPSDSGGGAPFCYQKISALYREGGSQGVWGDRGEMKLSVAMRRAARRRRLRWFSPPPGRGKDMLPGMGTNKLCQGRVIR